MPLNAPSLKKYNVITIDGINHILVVVIILFLGLMTFKFFADTEGHLDVEFAQEVLSEPVVLELPGTLKRNFDYYAQSISARDLFDPLVNEQAANPHLMEKAMPALHKQIKVVGILMDSDSKAIVEDLRDQQTHFLSKGERLGTVVLEDILEDKVIFQYDNQRVEMTP